jgi:ABC-type transport system involved in multi-copper enzyme maturation permease subunit
MYIWKCWRDTRVSFFVYLMLSASLTLLWFAGIRQWLRSAPINVSPLESLWFEIVTGAVAFGSLLAPVIGLTLGSRNIGTDLAKGSGDFLITRPRSRKYFIWAGWGVGIAEILTVLLVTGLVTLVVVYFQGGSIWRHIPTSAFAGSANNFPAVAESRPADVPQLLATVNVSLLMASVLLTATVLYGLTYFLSVLTQSGQRAIVYSLAVVLAYSIAGSLLSRWAHVSLPTLAFYKIGVEASQI